MKKIFLYIVYFFALLGFISSAVFVSMQFGLLNVRGSISERNEFFGTVPKTDNTNGCISSKDGGQVDTCLWIDTAEWKVVHDGLLKDVDIINRVSAETGVSSRMIVASVIPEQIRFFTSNRESFKRYFEPYKILGSLSKFSLGVSGIKQETALDIEEYATNPESEFYPGEAYADLIKYKDGTKSDSELFNRLTNSKDHYYSYLYTAIYLKEITMQWRKVGFEVSERPDVLVTLFNLGFKASKPNADPKVAGSIISVGGKNYSFGGLGTSFYESNELIETFPR